MKKYSILTFLLFVLSIQTSFANGAWTSYISSNFVFNLAVQDNYVWCATSGGVYRFNSDDETITQFTTSDGLPGNNVRKVHVASNGFVWIITTKGISYYDGVIWQSFTEGNGLGNSSVLFVVEDSNGGIWIGTRGGLTYFDGETPTVFTTDDGIADNDVVQLMEASDGTIWIGTRNGSSSYDGEKWISYDYGPGTNDYYIYTLFEDSTGAIWIGTQHGATKIDHEGMKTYTTTDGLSDNIVFCIAEAAGHIMWFGTNKGVTGYDGSNWNLYGSRAVREMHTDNDRRIWFRMDGVKYIKNNTVVPFRETDEPPNENIVIDDSGGKWVFATQYTGGISHFDGHKWQTFYGSDTLTGFPISSLHAVSNGVAWIGSPVGLVRFDGRSWKQFQLSDCPLNGGSQYMATDINGHVWVLNNGTYDGNLNRFDGEKWETVSIPNMKLTDRSMSMSNDKNGNVYVGSDNAVMIFDGYSWSPMDVEIDASDGVVSRICVDSIGRVWLGRGIGALALFDGTQWAKFNPDGGGILDGSIVDIIEDHDGNIWIASQRTIGRYDGKEWEYFDGNELPIGKFRVTITDLESDLDGNIWVCTHDGIARFDGAAWTIFTGAETGSSSDTINCCTADKNGNMWFGTFMGGEIRYDGDSWKAYIIEDGLAADTINSITTHPDGSVWFGTNSGVTVYRENTPVSVATQVMKPAFIQLQPAVPNPFNASTTIAITLVSPEKVILSIYSSSGQVIRNIIDDTLPAGRHTITWDGRDNNGALVSSGVYISALTSRHNVATAKVTLVK